MVTVISKKGTQCPYKPILCQEGYCQDCEILSQWLKELAELWSK